MRKPKSKKASVKPTKQEIKSARLTLEAKLWAGYIDVFGEENVRPSDRDHIVRLLDYPFFAEDISDRMLSGATPEKILGEARKKTRTDQLDSFCKLVESTNLLSDHLKLMLSWEMKIVKLLHLGEVLPEKDASNWINEVRDDCRDAKLPEDYRTEICQMIHLCSLSKSNTLRPQEGCLDQHNEDVQRLILDEVYARWSASIDQIPLPFKKQKDRHLNVSAYDLLIQGLLARFSDGTASANFKAVSAFINLFFELRYLIKKQSTPEAIRKRDVRNHEVNNANTTPRRPLSHAFSAKG